MRVLVAMSGGVDSSVAAALLRDAGYEVCGVTMKLWGGPSDRGCCSVSDVDDARRVADHLGIDHHVFNFEPDFDALVVDPYVEAHRRGRTPNPCIECNRHLKFGRLTERARLLGFDAVATGHHARIVRHGGRSFVARGADRSKDQSYVLHPVRPPTLDRVLLPIGALQKSEVRTLAHELGLRTAAKPDSQDVCFITASHGRERFLADRMALHSGDVTDRAGRTVGTVAAVELVTVGQRRGLGRADDGDRHFALTVDIDRRQVAVGREADLLTDETRLETFSWVHGPVDDQLVAQASAHGVPAPAAIRVTGSAAVVRWREPHRRVAPGQSVVFYAADRVVASGSVLPPEIASDKRPGDA